MDAVYYVRPGDRNDELRYSLRSLANLPHDRVWIVGHTPPWVTGIESIQGNTVGGGPQQTAQDPVPERDRFIPVSDRSIKSRIEIGRRKKAIGIPWRGTGMTEEQCRDPRERYEPPAVHETAAASSTRWIPLKRQNRLRSAVISP